MRTPNHGGAPWRIVLDLHAQAIEESSELVLVSRDGARNADAGADPPLRSSGPSLQSRAPSGARAQPAACGAACDRARMPPPLRYRSPGVHALRLCAAESA